MAESPVLVEIRPGYRILTLNRPHRLNAFTEDLHRMLAQALEQAEKDPACRALLITGAGRAFCSGQDLSERLPRDGKMPVVGPGLEQFYNPLVRKLRELPLPIVAAVNGVAAGAGCNVALACDIVIAARSATFIQSFAKIGLIPDSGGTWILPRLVGQARARGLALMAEPLAAEKAESWGLIWKAVDDDKLIAEAERLCAHFASAPTVALGLAKRALNQSEDNSLAAQLDLERELQGQAGSTTDYVEGVRAFVDKRPPVFTGRKEGQ